MCLKENIFPYLKKKIFSIKDCCKRSANQNLFLACLHSTTLLDGGGAFSISSSIRQTRPTNIENLCNYGNKIIL